jgi:hypothetical protein
MCTNPNGVAPGPASHDAPAERSAEDELNKLGGLLGALMIVVDTAEFADGKGRALGAVEVLAALALERVLLLLDRKDLADAPGTEAAP